MKLLSIFLVLLLVTLQLTLWFGDDSLAEVWQLRQQINAQTDENKQLQERNSALEAEVQDLKKGLAAIEERARTELGMVKKDETFFQVVEEEGDTEK